MGLSQNRIEGFHQGKCNYRLNNEGLPIVHRVYPDNAPFKLNRTLEIFDLIDRAEFITTIKLDMSYVIYNHEQEIHDVCKGPAVKMDIKNDVTIINPLKEFNNELKIITDDLIKLKKSDNKNVLILIKAYMLDKVLIIKNKWLQRELSGFHTTYIEKKILILKKQINEEEYKKQSELEEKELAQEQEDMFILEYIQIILSK